jgi:putative peptide zinc metalloprotease protein
MSTFSGVAARTPEFPRPSALSELPRLREDLMLVSSANNRDGSPTWVIQDPIRNKFIKIGWLEFELLSRWQPSPEGLMEELVTGTDLRPHLNDVLAFAQFLKREGLTQWGHAEDINAARLKPSKPGMGDWRWWLHNYLFFRIPLARPDQALSRWLPRVEWLLSPWSFYILLLLSLCGLGLAARQWEAFAQTFVDSLTVTGFVSFAVALMFAKILHELGHAFVATHYGLKVAHMGVAFLVLWPMLYTDTSESWRLREPAKRLHIAIAGIAVEASLAGLSLLGWALVPPGALKSAFFYLATTSLVMTLALNLSPFMRFDGYFVVSDALNMPNLHERSGALARTWLRRTFLGWREPWSESFVPKLRRTLIGFALATWVYRLFLFLGIAVAVYLMFFKALGIFLFVVEIVWFILRPVVAEMRVWGRRSSETQAGRASLWLLVALAMLCYLAWPRAHLIHGPAQLMAEHLTIYSPQSAQLVTIKATGMAQAGEALMVLDSPKLRNDAVRARINTQATQAALVSAQLSGDSRELRPEARGEQRSDDRSDQVGKLEQTVEQFAAEGRAAGQELERLKLVAKFSGRWTDVDPSLTPGAWVRPQDALGILVDDSTWHVEAWISEDEVQQLKLGSTGKFYHANRIDESVSIKLIEIDSMRATSLPHPGLSTEHGGSIPTVTENKVLVPRASLYRVKLQVMQPSGQARWSRGRIAIEGERYSLVWQGVSYLLAAVIRESGF